MEQTRTIERSRDDRVVLGVCGGVARALDVDPTIVRVVTVILVAVGGVGLLAYVVAALLLPEEGGRPIVDLGIDTDRKGTIVGVVVLAAVVILLLGDPFPFDEPGTLLLVLAIGVGGWLLLRDRDRAIEPDAGRAAATGGAADPAGGGGGATATAAPPAEPSTAVTVSSPRALDTRPLPHAAPAGGPPGGGPEAPEHPPAEPRRRRRRGVEAVAWGAVLLGVAAGAAILQAVVDEPAWDVFAAAVVVLVGAVLLLAAPFGGAPGLLVCGFLLAAGVGVVAASDLNLEGGAGDRRYQPLTVADLRDEYRLGAGTMDLDLSRLDLPPGTTTVDAEIGFGELLIDVPPDADVTVQASANAGEIVLFGATDDGLGVDTTRSSEGSGSSRLVIDAHVGFGHIDVERVER